VFIVSASNAPVPTRLGVQGCSTRPLEAKVHTRVGGSVHVLTRRYTAYTSETKKNKTKAKTTQFKAEQAAASKPDRTSL